MSTQRECQVIMLPSEDSSHIVINNYLNARDGRKAIQYLDELIPTVKEAEERGYTPQHLYVVTDGDINVGDWYIHSWHGELDVQQFTSSQIEDREEHYEHYRLTCKKIIATTDKELSLPSLSTGFIKKYCEIRGIDNVLVEFEENSYYGRMNESKYNLIVRPGNTIITYPVKTEWSREEVISVLFKYASEEWVIDSSKDRIEEFNEWIDKNI